MPIEQVKPTNLSDVWNPMQALGPAMQLNQMDLERQRIGIEQERMTNLQTKADDAELLNILKIADLPPTVTYRAAQKLLKKHGFELDPVDFTKFEPLYKQFLTSAYTNGPDAKETVAAGQGLIDMSSIFRGNIERIQSQARESAKVQGMQEITTRAMGKPASMNEAEAVAGSPALQKEMGGAIAQSPLNQEKMKQLQQTQEDLQIRTQTAKQQLESLASYNMPTFLDLNMESAYLASKQPASTKAGQAIGDVRQDDDALATRYGTLTKEERAQALTAVDGQLKDLRSQQRTLTAQIRQGLQLSGTDKAFDVKPLQDNLNAINQAIKVKLAEQPYLKNGDIGSFNRLRAEQESYDGLIRSKQDEITALQNLQAGAFSAATNEKHEEFAATQANLSETAKAQSEFASLPTDQQTPQNAAKIASKHKNVLTEKVMESVKNPNKPLTEVKIENVEPASVEAQKEFMKSTRETYQQLKQVPTQLENLERAKALIPQAKGFMGPAGESLLEAAKFLNNRLGTQIDTEGVKGAEELRSRIFFNVMDNLKKMDAQPSQLQQQIMMDSLGKLGTDPAALSHVLDAYGDALRGKVELHNREVKSAEDRGVKFPYKATIDLPKSAKASGKGPAIGTIEDGYRFKGGNPSDPKNGEKAK